MNRMGIFIFYDGQGIVDKYIEVLLSSMQEILQKLIIVINGSVQNEEYSKLKVYSNDIYIRENIGFDAGGYKDVFTKFLSKEDLKQWDEIVLFNDTFYGPLYPWKDIFKEMERIDINFWGLSRHSGKRIEEDPIPPHIQAFFLVCRKSLITSASWQEFWDNLEYPRNIHEAIWNFEINFSVFFTQRGFTCKALTDNGKTEYIGNPYTRYSYELIRDVEFPVIKRKVIALSRFKNLKAILNYILSNTEYDADLIYSHIRRLQKEERYNIFYPFKEHDLEAFYHAHKRIYIYGNGNYGQGMAVYFEYKGWEYAGFLVTEKTEKNEKNDNVYVYHSMNFNKDDGIILALGEKAFSDVYPMIEGKLDVSQLLLPKLK